MDKKTERVGLVGIFIYSFMHCACVEFFPLFFRLFFILFFLAFIFFFSFFGVLAAPPLTKNTSGVAGRHPPPEGDLSDFVFKMETLGNG